MEECRKSEAWGGGGAGVLPIITNKGSKRLCPFSGTGTCILNGKDFTC